MTRATSTLPILLAAALAGAPALAQSTTPKPSPAPPTTSKPGSSTPAPAKPATGTPAATAKKPLPDGLAPVRVRVVVNGVYSVSGPSYSDVREVPEYAETTTIRTSYEAKGAFGPGGALQVTLFRGLGLLVGYSGVSRDVGGTVDVSRPHPLYLNRPRTASAELSGYGAKETALDFDLAYAGGSGRIDWSLFAGVTLFDVDTDVLGVPTYSEAYPYDELSIVSTPSTTVKSSATGWNAGARLDYRFGARGRFGAGVQLRYSAATVEPKAATATTPASYDAGGLEVAAGLRLYF